MPSIADPAVISLLPKSALNPDNFSAMQEMNTSVRCHVFDLLQRQPRCATRCGRRASRGASTTDCYSKRGRQMIRHLISRAGLRISFLASLVCMLLISIRTAPTAVAPQPGDFQGCPEPGQGGDPDLNRLKNRSAPVATIEPMTVAQINALPLPLEALRGKRATWPASTRQEITRMALSLGSIWIPGS